ncbi:MAG: glycosyltransferase family 2 protein [Chloroflexus sp.]|uniref:glycosyltransferase family 2 protein n=1 Tax=Chloroflexus sp. TaxID=1904827 RepID=UPI0030B6343E
MRIVVIILSWNALDAILSCIDSLTQQSVSTEILIVDNASRDEVVRGIIDRYPNVRIIRNQRNLGFAGGMNTGINAVVGDHTSPDVIVLLNQDTILDTRCIEHLAEPLIRDEHVAVVGAKIRYSDGTIQHAGVRLEWPRAIAHHIGWHEPDRGQYDTLQECDFVTGAAIALRLKALNEVGLFDEGFTPAYFEDIDLCTRMRNRGWKIVYNPAATLVHCESLSLPDELQRSCYYNRGRLRFIFKHYTLSDIEEAFFPVELDHIQRHALWPVESRALRWAYAETMLHWNDILRARRQVRPDLLPGEIDRLTQVLLQLQRSQATALWQHAYQRANWMFNH